MKRLLPLLLAVLALLPAVGEAASLFDLVRFGRAAAKPSATEPAAASSSPLENARRAQAMLGPEVWSRVIRVENHSARSRYPRTVYALVFEEAGILWFYSDTDGTQSFSLHPDSLAEEKADFGPLLRDIDPGFVAHEILADGAGFPGPGVGVGLSTDADRQWGQRRPALPNGCFIDSLVALRDRVRRGECIERARLLSCYIDTPAGRRGHTVLTYETPRGVFLLDPSRSPEPRAVAREWTEDALALANEALPGIRIARARWVPTAVPPTSLVAEIDYSNNNPGPGVAPRLMR